MVKQIEPCESVVSNLEKKRPSGLPVAPEFTVSKIHLSTLGRKSVTENIWVFTDRSFGFVKSG